MEKYVTRQMIEMHSSNCGNENQVRLAALRGNKASTLYGTDSYCVALTASPSGSGFLSGHADGSVVRWYVAEDPAARGQQGKVLVHPVPPYALGWTAEHIACAGSDKKIVLYTADGAMFQQFDYFNDPAEKEFTVMCCSPSGQVRIGKNPLGATRSNWTYFSPFPSRRLFALGVTIESGSTVGRPGKSQLRR